MRTLIEEFGSNLLSDGGHDGSLKVDDQKHYEKNWYEVHWFDTGLSSFNEKATSIMCWYLHTFEKQISRWPVIHVQCYHMQESMGLSSSSWNKARKCSLEDLVIGTTKEDLSGQIHLQSDAFFFTNVESLIDMWSHSLIKDKNKPSILSIIVKFWKFCSHPALKKDWNGRRNLSSTTIIHAHIFPVR